MQKNHFLLLKKLKNTESAQLWFKIDYTWDTNSFRALNWPGQGKALQMKACVVSPSCSHISRVGPLVSRQLDFRSEVCHRSIVCRNARGLACWSHTSRPKKWSLRRRRRRRRKRRGGGRVCKIENAPSVNAHGRSVKARCFQWKLRRTL